MSFVIFVCLFIHLILCTCKYGTYLMLHRNGFLFHVNCIHGLKHQSKLAPDDVKLVNWGLINLVDFYLETSHNNVLVTYIFLPAKYLERLLLLRKQ